LLLAGCSHAESDDGVAIARAIRMSDSPIVRFVAYVPGDPLDPARIDVYVFPGATAAEIDGLVCHVIEPALNAHQPPDSLGVWIVSSKPERLITADDEQCR
jgi:hypothetical protein